jgi:hypothetical protein
MIGHIYFLQKIYWLRDYCLPPLGQWVLKVFSLYSENCEFANKNSDKFWLLSSSEQKNMIFSLYEANLKGVRKYLELQMKNIKYSFRECMSIPKG